MRIRHQTSVFNRALQLRDIANLSLDYHQTTIMTALERAHTHTHKTNWAPGFGPTPVGQTNKQTLEGEGAAGHRDYWISNFLAREVCVSGAVAVGLCV